MKISKPKLKKLIEKASFLSEPDKKDWLRLADLMSEGELYEACSHFTNAEQAEYNFTVNLIAKANLGDDFDKRVKQTFSNIKRKTQKKEESHQRSHEEKPEDILNKLKDI